MRLFVAVDLPDPVRDALERVQEALPVGRTVDPETLHLTLAFLGELSEDQAVELNEALQDVRAPAFTLRLKGLGTFGKRMPTTLWAGVTPEPALKLLHGKVRDALRRAGLELPRERFRPHVTLARFRGRLDAIELERLRRFLEAFGAVEPPPCEVDRVTLFRSYLRPDGAEHEALAEYPLRG